MVAKLLIIWAHWIYGVKFLKLHIMFGLRIKLMAFCLLFLANGVDGQYDSVRYDMTTLLLLGFMTLR